MYTISQNNRTQLFLLHFAGGSCYSFEFLKKHISDVDFIALELPGRGKRFNEKLLKKKSKAIDDYVEQIKKARNDNPFILFGHSMGATLALSVANKLAVLHNDSPMAIIVSGNAGPGKHDDDRSDTKRYLMDDINFKKELQQLGGVPDEVIENEELFELFSPIMRADFEVLEKDNFSERGIKLNVPISAIMGSEEKTNWNITNWKNFTNSRFDSKIVAGNHFFIYDHPQIISKLITDINCKHTKKNKEKV